MTTPNQLSIQPQRSALIAQLERINQSAALGRSKVNRKLVNYLVEYYLDSIENGEPARAPKEIEIATNALGKAQDFNPAEDAAIRVYISNLRKKLEAYYQNEGQQEAFQITIPPGGYALEFVNVSSQTEDSELPVSNLTAADTQALLLANQAKGTNVITALWILAGLLVVSVLVNVWALATKGSTAPDTNDVVRQHSLWQPLFTNQKPTLIVIGDLYFLSERDPETKQVRALREFGINNDKDLQQYFAKYPQKRNTISKADSAFILKNSVFALQHILPLFESDKPLTIKLASELSPADLRDFNLIYIGLYKSLGLLDAYFQGSNFVTQKNNPALTHKTSGQAYRITGDLKQEYTDYGSFARFQGPSGNQVYLFAGFSDASVIQMAKYLTNLNKLTSAEFIQHYPEESSTQGGESSTQGKESSTQGKESSTQGRESSTQGKESSAQGFELIFSASSFDRTDLDSNIVNSGTLDTKAIWSMPL